MFYLSLQERLHLPNKRNLSEIKKYEILRFLTIKKKHITNLILQYLAPLITILLQQSREEDKKNRYSRQLKRKGEKIQTNCMEFT